MRKKLLSALLVCVMLIQPAFAYVGINTNSDASLTISYIHSGVSFRIYRVADVSKTVRFTLCDDFAQHSDLQPMLDDWDWDKLADILDARVVRDKISPTASGKTDKNGTLTFSDLTPGLYLMMGDTYHKGNKTYYFKTSLISIPNLMPDDTWEYDPVVSLKYSTEKDPENPTPSNTSISVQKIWQDAGFETERPASITVQLLKNGEIEDTVILDAENNWRWTWSGLPSGHQYRVVEASAPDGYSDRYSREGNTVVIINTLIDEPEKPTDPTHPTNPTDPTRPTNPTNPTNPTTPDKPEYPGIDIPDDTPPLEEPLPETGQLWWPVPLLTMAGLLLIIIGLIRRRGASYEE